jgi:hypothetical protein
LFVPCRLSIIRSGLIAAMVGLPLLVGTPALAKPIEPGVTSVQAAIDDFVAYLKSETNEAMSMAARLARDHDDDLAAATSYLDRQFSAWRDLLSDQKARAATLADDASATWHAWREAAASSWAIIERQAVDALDWIQSWMRHALKDQSHEAPV